MPTMSRPTSRPNPSHIRALLTACALTSCVGCASINNPATTRAAHADAAPAAVHPAAETQPTVSREDAADDPAIWVHPTDPDRSLVLGSDKDAGLGVYTLQGEQVAFHTVGSINNIDTAICNGTHIAAGTAVDSNALFVWRIDPETRTLTRIDRGGLPSTLPSVYGFALTTLNGQTLALTTSKAGLTEITRLDITDTTSSNASPRMTATHIATIPVGGQLEGIVADPANRTLYIGEEAVGVWRYDLPTTATGTIDWAEALHHRRLVDTCRDTQGVGNITSDAEGVTLYAPDNSATAGYLIVSSQGSDRYTVYTRAVPNTYLGSFQITQQPHPTGDPTATPIDGTTHTDGIAASAAPLGSAHPRGLFVAQDDDNSPERQNFKIVDWHDIERAMKLPSRD